MRRGSRRAVNLRMRSRPFKLLVDARCVRAARTGVGNGIFRQLQGIERLFAAGEITPDQWQVSAIRFAPDLDVADFGERWRLLPHIRPIDSAADPEAHPAGDIWLQRDLPRLAARMGADALYSPAYAGPWGRGSCPQILFVHDDLVWSQASSYPLKFRLYLGATMRMSARAASLVLFPSRDAARRCLPRLGIPARRARVVWHGLDEAIFHPAPRPPAREPVGLYVASAERRKNHEVLVRAAAAGFSGRLRFVGFSPRATERLAELHALGASNRWEVVPGRSESEVAEELRRAAFAVQPSLGEGFGLPMIEAMACGTPLIAADIPVLREVGGDAPWYVAPHDAEAWRRAMDAALAGGAAVEERVARGIERAKVFTLEAAARRLLRAVRGAAARR